MNVRALVLAVAVLAPTALVTGCEKSPVAALDGVAKQAQAPDGLVAKVEGWLSSHAKAVMPKIQQALKDFESAPEWDVGARMNDGAAPMDEGGARGDDGAAWE